MNQIKFGYFIYLVITILIFSCSENKESLILSEKMLYKVIRIVDGDTYVIQDNDGTKEKIRIIGADTPETKHPKKGKEPYGPEATNFAKRYLSNKLVNLKFEKGKRDRYKRILAHVYVNGIHFNKMLIDSGMAKTSFYAPNYDFKEAFKKAENKAIASKTGMWRGK